MEKRNKPKPKKMHPSEIRDRALILTAVYFTVFRARGLGAHLRERHATVEAALASAAGDNRAIVYAVTPIGQSIMVPEGYTRPHDAAA